MNPAIERKLNTIYDLLDAREFKKAFKQTQNCIQKMNHSVFYAAQALTLQRMGKISEALETANSLKATPLEDRVTIDILTLIYRSLGMSKEAAEMHELQYEHQPAVETAESLFSAYATEFEVEKQFSLSMKLMKGSDNSKYTLWAVLSLVLSVEIGRSKPASLGLAEQLLKKLAAKQGFVESEQTVRIQMAILRIAGKTGGLLELLQTKGRFLDNPAELAELTARCQRDMSQLIPALNTIIPVIRLNLREETALSIWQLYRLYLETITDYLPKGAFQSDWRGFEEEGEGFEEVREGEDGERVGRKAIKNLRRTQREMEGGSSFARNIRRTGLLAEVEMYRLMWTTGRVSLESEAKDSRSPMEQPLLDYLTLYFDIPSAPEDLLPYFRILTQSQASILSSSLDLLLAQTSPSPLTQMRKEICFSKVKRYLDTLPVDISQVIRWFQAYKDLTLTEPPPKKGEHRVGDEILLLASELLRNSEHSLKTEISVILLQYGVQASPYNFNLKIRLMEEWQKLGYTAAALQLYLELDIKAIQHETLGHLIFSGLQDSPHLVTELQTFCHKVEQFHRTAITDLSDSISTAYSHFNYEGIKDFFEFKKKLSASRLKPTAELTSLYCKVIEKFNHIKEVSSHLKDSTPILKRLLSLPCNTTPLCDLSCFYSCSPLALRIPSWPASPAPPADTESRGYGHWAHPVFFKAYTGMMVFAANFLNSDHELFTQEELDMAKDALEAATREHWGRASKMFEICVAALKFASGILIVVKGDASITGEALEASKSNFSLLKSFFDWAKSELISSLPSFSSFLSTYAGLIHWPQVLTSLILAAMERIVPEPRKKKKGKKMSEADIVSMKLAGLLKDCGEMLAGMKTCVEQGVDRVRTGEGSEGKVREAFSMLGCLSEVPEFLTELETRCAKERSAPLDYLRDWMISFPIHRAPDSTS